MVLALKRRISSVTSPASYLGQRLNSAAILLGDWGNRAVEGHWRDMRWPDAGPELPPSTQVVFCLERGFWFWSGGEAIRSAAAAATRSPETALFGML
jgi:hypothetical protein